MTALPPAQASLAGSLIGSGIFHSLLAILIVTASSRWKSSATMSSEPSTASISVTLAPPQPESPELLDTQNAEDSPIPDQSQLDPPEPGRSIDVSPPTLPAFHFEKPGFADAPPMELVTVSEGPQFGNSLPIADPKRTPEEPRPHPEKKLDTPPARPSSAKPASTPPKSTKHKKSPTTIQKTGISRSVRLRNRASIRYPAKEKATGIQGDCIIEVAVNISGRVTSARIVKSSGNRRLDAEALRCAKSARYYPAMKNGKAFAARARLPFRFRIK